MSDAWLFLWPSPFHPLIALPGLSFAGNGVKHETSVSECLQREQKGVSWPVSPASVLQTKAGGVVP